jgi:hypothetical protein
MSWKRPKTIKVYLHPPEAKRLITLWPDFKIVDRKIETIKGEAPDDFGIHFVFGKEARALDWHQIRFKIRPDGIPVHTLAAAQAQTSFELESFCSWDALPDTYARLTITNNAKTKSKLAMGVMPRLGKAGHLYGIEGDFYATYRPLLEQWDMVKNNWIMQGPVLVSGEKTISFAVPDKVAFNWVPQNKKHQFARNYVEFHASLEKKESVTLYFILSQQGHARVDGEKYQTAHDLAVSRWQAELAKIKVRPKLPDKRMETMFNSLVCQCLQMFAVGHDGLVRPRQGGQYHGVWPVEAIEFLTAFDRIGLAEWARKGYDFFAHNRIKEGEDKGKFTAAGAPQWMSCTGAALYGLAYHLKAANSREYFTQWRDLAAESIDWVEKQRTKTKTDPAPLGYGLLPAGIGNDWDIKGQYWSATDGLMYMGIRDLAKLFSLHNDPLAGQLTAIAQDYEKCLKNALRQVCEPQKKRDELFLPNILGMEETYPPLGPYFADGPTTLVRAGIIDPHSDVFKKMEKYFRNRGWMKNGLTSLMTDSLLQFGFQGDPWAGHTWYVSYADMIWFNAWLARGERHKAKQTLLAQFRYAMTPEFYMQERYADNDPDFCPWQPNASANGRTIMMLLDFYGEKKVSGRADRR